MATPPQDQFSDSRNIAWQHYQELGHYLRSKSEFSARQGACLPIALISNTADLLFRSAVKTAYLRVETPKKSSQG